MSWQEFVSSWARAFDGYNIAHAPAPKRKSMRAVHRLAGALAWLGVRPSTTMMVSATASLAVPVLAWQEGPWPAAAALALLFGLATDTVTAALSVVSQRITKLGAFYQSLLDRLAESCWLVALAALGAHVVLVVICAALVWGHEYVRARCGLGRAGTATIGDRPARIWLALAGLVLAAVTAQIGQDLAAGVVTLVVFAWAALALIGISQLFSIIKKVLA